jgi:phosphatidylglycerophosphate synthase
MPLLPALAVADVNRLWWLIPLAFAVSFAYTASRYELREAIIRRSMTFFWKTLAFMVAIFALLYVLAIGL